MKLLVTIHNSMFDAALPLLKQLKGMCDLHCLLEFDMTEDNIFGVTEDDFSGHFYIPNCNKIKKHKLAQSLPNENIVLIKYYPPRCIWGHIKTQLNELKVLRAISPDFIYFFNTPLPSSLYILLSNVNWATAVHDPIPHSDENHVFIRSLLSWPIYYKCKDYFLFSENLVEDFKRYRKLTTQKVHLTRLGAYEILNPTLDLSFSESKELKLLFFGKIKQYKGLRYLLKAYRRLYNKDISLTIAGSGYIEDDIVDLNNCPGLTILNRFIGNEELASLIRECDVVICPYTDATQSGVIMSAYSYCKPVIATNVGGLSMMIRDNIDGKLIPAKDEDALYNEIIKLRDDRSILKAWSNNIKARYFEGDCSWNVIARKLLNDIEAIIETK